MRLKIKHKKKLYRRIDAKGKEAAPRKKGGASLNLEHVLAQMEYDPLMLLYMIATRDVVGLRWMTKEDLARPQIIDDEGRVIQISGQEKADKLCPPDMRKSCAEELAPYTHFKVVTALPHANNLGPSVQVAGAQSEGTTATVSFTMPNNTR